MNSVIEIKQEEVAAGRKAALLIETVFLRCLALVFVYLTAKTWLMAVGYWDDGNLRFDTMSNPWRTYISVLAVLQPVVAVGLWSTQSWGRLLWLSAVAIEVIAMTTFSDTFGTDIYLIIFHIICCCIYTILQLWLHVSAKKG